MNERFRITGLALGALTLAFQAGCHNQPTAPPSDPIVQTVRIEPAQPRQGDRVTIFSSLENRGSKPVRATYRICALTLGGDLDLRISPGLGLCAAEFASGYVAPGQREEMSAVGTVRSGAGDYTLTVSHVVDPQRIATIKVNVSQ